MPTDCRGHILIVDDNGAIRSLLAEALKDRGYRVASAATGSSMRGFLDSGGIDAVVLDLRIPEEDGHLLALHVIERGLPTIMMSGSGDETGFAESHGVPLLRKPFRMQELFAALDAALATGGSRQT